MKKPQKRVIKVHALAILYSYLSFCLCMHIIIFVSAHNTLFKNKMFNKLIVTIVSNFQGIINYTVI